MISFARDVRRHRAQVHSFTHFTPIIASNRHDGSSIPKSFVGRHYEDSETPRMLLS